ncbi:tRNA pseudouridine(55) synthase TruB [Limisalsivibrio acetivorans]|uniref:tRNA pseudouridine(55) synthase TruB n=1 Tax=Limisalsivibrio acetivorans TaxID=1304888 RepID=UPI0003B460AA|nr:tRNA pseudouridine(55) synthase TruB [Limisalsivibrio acetivorans]
MNGIVNLYKEKGMTSFKAVDRLRRVLKVKKSGHLGTLDPLAEGVLPICIGNATKFVNYLMDVEKEYVGEMELGFATDSYDTEGEVTAEEKGIVPSEDDVLAVLAELTGDVELPIPAFSAVKLNGKRAYELARKGEIEDAGRRVMGVRSIELMEYSYPRCVIRVRCAKGTYIRSIIHEAGLRLGCYARMSGLIRTANGKLTAKESVTLERLEELKEEGRAEEAVTPVWDMLNWPRATVDAYAARLVLNGVSIKEENYSTFPSDLAEGEHCFIEDEAGKILAFALKKNAGNSPLKIVKVIGKND